MTAQLANGGFKINPKIIVNKKDLTIEEIKSKMSENLEKKIDQLKSTKKKKIKKAKRS